MVRRKAVPVRVGRSRCENFYMRRISWTLGEMEALMVV